MFKEPEKSKLKKSKEDLILDLVANIVTAIFLMCGFSLFAASLGLRVAYRNTSFIEWVTNLSSFDWAVGAAFLFILGLLAIRTGPSGPI